MGHVERNPMLALVRAASNDATLRHISIENKNPVFSEHYTKVVSSLVDAISPSSNTIETFIISGVSLPTSTWKTLAEFASTSKHLVQFEVTGVDVAPKEVYEEFQFLMDSSIPFVYLGADGIRVRFNKQK